MISIILSRVIFFEMIKIAGMREITNVGINNKPKILGNEKIVSIK